MADSSVLKRCTDCQKRLSKAEAVLLYEEDKTWLGSSH